MPPLAMITDERMNNKMDLRLQINVDKQAMAYAYNPMVDNFGAERMEKLRNRMAEAAAAAIIATFEDVLALDPEFGVYLTSDYMMRLVAPNRRAEARGFWRAHGLLP